MRALRLALWVAALLLASPAVSAEPEPTPVDRVDIVEHLGAKLPLDAEFRDSTGAFRPLSSYLSSGRPVVLSFAYFDCPMLCSLLLNGLTRSMQTMDLKLGRDYDALTVSFDPADDFRVAAKKRHGYLQELDVADGVPVWPFLTGQPDPIRRLTDALGFRYAPVPHSRELAHAAAIYVITPDGDVSRYLYGVEFPVRDLKLAIVEASAGRVGSSFDRLLLRCYRYDPASRRYALFVASYFRVAGVVILALVGGLIFRLWRRELSSSSKGAPAKG